VPILRYNPDASRPWLVAIRMDNSLCPVVFELLVFSSSAGVNVHCLVLILRHWHTHTCRVDEILNRERVPMTEMVVPLPPTRNIMLSPFKETEHVRVEPTLNDHELPNDQDLSLTIPPSSSFTQSRQAGDPHPNSPLWMHNSLSHRACESPDQQMRYREAQPGDQKSNPPIPKRSTQSTFQVLEGVRLSYEHD
jgi:hypothetical protein